MIYFEVLNYVAFTLRNGGPFERALSGSPFDKLIQTVWIILFMVSISSSLLFPSRFLSVDRAFGSL
jgi:hypothetical protein